MSRRGFRHYRHDFEKAFRLGRMEDSPVKHARAIERNSRLRQGWCAYHWSKGLPCSTMEGSGEDWLDPIWYPPYIRPDEDQRGPYSEWLSNAKCFRNYKGAVWHC